MEPLGPGRFGPTWTAEGPEGERLVVKRLTGLAPAAPEAAELAARMAAVPRCVAPLDLEARDGDLWVVYPFVEGRTAVEAAATLGPGVGTDVRRAVADLHAAGLAHGALSDSNVRVTAGGEVWLLDAGLAGLGALGAVRVATIERDRRDLTLLLRRMAEAARRDGTDDARRVKPRLPRPAGGAALVSVAVVAVVAVVVGAVVAAVSAAGRAHPAAGGGGGGGRARSSPPRSPARCATASLPDVAAASYFAVDTSGTGCVEPMAWRAGVIYTVSPEGAPVRFSLGQPGDVLLVGRWSCAPVELPALYRPRTGEVFYIRSWPMSGGTVTSEPAVETGVRDGTVRTTEVGGCQHVEVVG